MTVSTAWANGTTFKAADLNELTAKALHHDSVGDIYSTGAVYLGSTNPTIPSVEEGDIWVAGSLQVGEGALLITRPWSASVATLPVTGFGTPDAGTLTFTLTGGSADNFVTVVPTGGWTFDSADVGKAIVLVGGTYDAALALITEIVSGTEVIVETCGWSTDLPAGTAFIMPSNKISFTSPNLKTNNITATGKWRNNALDHTEEWPTEFWASMAADGVTNIRIYTDCQGYNNSDTLQFRHIVGDLQAGETQKVIRIVIDDSECTGGATADIEGIKFSRTKNGSLANVCAVRVGTDFSDAILVESNPATDPNYGYTFTSAFAVTNTIAAFTDAGTNIQIFTADNSGILIGSDDQFSVIECALSIGASTTITPTFEYSTGDGTWAVLTVSDTTLGFRESGKISFEPPALWVKSAHCNGATGAITNAYYIRITRTTNNVPTPPTENYFEIYVGGSITEAKIRGDGTIKPTQMIDATAVNDSIYYSLTANKLCYKTSTGGVLPLTT